MELERFGSISMEALLMRKRLRWVGHVRRMNDSPLPKRLMYAELLATIPTVYLESATKTS